MAQDNQQQYLVQFTDKGSVNKLKKEIRDLENIIERFQTKVKMANGEVARLVDAQRVAASQGFSSNPKFDRAANSYISGGGLEAEKKQAAKRGVIAKRTTEEAQLILDLNRDGRQRLKRFYTALEQKQAVHLTTLTRQEFLDKKVTTLKDAQVKLEAAKLRAGMANRANLNNNDARSNGRLIRELGEAELDVRNLQGQVTSMQKMASLQARIDAQQTKINGSLDRANLNRRQGNVLEARKELIKARIAKAQLLNIRYAEAETRQAKTQIALEQTRLAQSTKRANARVAEDPFSKRFANGGAGLFKVQAQLLANYAAMGLALQTLSFAGRFVVSLDKEFAQLQAITATTDESMGKLEKTIIKVSEGVKFTALEVAEAATVMGQAGFSVDQITNSIGEITLLATAVGTDLKTAVDLVTSTISVFNLRAEEAGNISNVFTTAVNNSKLNLEKLTLGLQYAGNIANEQNITFSELTATLGAMANSGIRSGSTLGTGLRQILTALAAPSEKLKSRLDDLNLTTEDVNVKLHGLTGVLNNLQEAGFTTSDALQVLEVRAGAAYAALTNNSGTIEELRQRFLLSSAAAEANATQMSALANKGARLQSVFGTLAAKGLDPLVTVAKVVVDTLSLLLSTLNKLGPVVPVLTTSLGALTIAFTLFKTRALLAGLGVKTFTQRLLANSVAIKANKMGLMTLLTSLNPVAAAITGLTLAIPILQWGFDALTVSMDELQSKVESSSGRMDTYASNVRAIDKEIEILAQRHFEAGASMEEVKNIALELQLKFGDLGATFQTTSGDASQLIPELERLRDVMMDLNGLEAAQNVISLKAVGNKLDRDRSVFINQNSRYVNGRDAGRFNFNSDNSNERFGSDLLNLVRSGASRDELYSARDKISVLTRPMNEEVLRLAKSNTAEARRRLKQLEKELDIFRQLSDQISMRLSNFAEQELAQRIQTDSVNAGHPKVKAAREALFGPEEGFTKQLANIKASQTAGPTTAQGKADLEALLESVQTFKTRLDKELESLGGSKEVGLDTEIAALVSNIRSASKGTEQDVKEREKFFRLRQSALQSEIKAIEKDLSLKDNALSIAQGKAKALARFDIKSLEYRQEELRKLEEAGASEELIEKTKAELLRKEFSQREILISSFDKLSLQKIVRDQKTSYETLNFQLEKEINLEKKRVSEKSSVYEIEKAKERALAVQTQLEIAAREDLRFRLRNESDRLPLELLKLNETLLGERELLAASFDELHEEISENQVKEFKNTLGKLNKTFKAASRDFENKITALQGPVEGLKAQRAAMDTPENKGRFSDSSRNLMDRRIRMAEIDALRAEVDLIRTENLNRLTTEEIRYEALKAVNDRNIAAAEEVLANYNQGTNLSSKEDADEASANLLRFKSEGLKLDEDIKLTAEEIATQLLKIKSLQAQIGGATGTAAPAVKGWAGSMKQGLQDYVNWLEDAQIKSDEFADVVGGVMQNATSELGNAFSDIVTGAKSVGEAFGNMAEAILKSILDILAQQVAIFAIKQLFGFFGFDPQTLATGEAVQGKATGGAIRGYAGGGTIPSLGVTGRDHVPIIAEAGEFMMRKSAVDSIGRDRLYAMNAMGKDALDIGKNIKIQLPDGQGGTKEVNVYILAPEEKPQLGPDDILYVVGQDILTGGKTKQLVKHVMMN